MALTGWRVNAWVKMGILLGFRIGEIKDMSADHGKLPFFDKSTFPLKKLSADSGVRVVPGGSSIRDGCYIARGVTCMPPMYINAGAYVDEGTMVDSHALVGSLRADRQARPPLGRQPDRRRAGAGRRAARHHRRRRADRRQLRRLRRDGGQAPRGARRRNDSDRARRRSTTWCAARFIAPRGRQPLVIPEEAVVVPGSRAVTSGTGKEWGISLYTPVIVKYRDSKTDQPRSAWKTLASGSRAEPALHRQRRHCSAPWQ